MRGNNRGPIFLDDLDREIYLAVLGRAKLKYRWQVHAYCLMGNHYHVLLETPEPNIAAGMQWVNSLYSHGFNKRYERVGHVFQRRYAAELIADEEHLREVVRYVPLNPLRAGLCKRADDYTWSSYRATLGMVRRPPFLTVRMILGLFDSDLEPARHRYRAWVDEGAARPRRKDSQLPLSTFLRPGKQVSAQDIRTARQHGHSLSAIGRHLGVSHTWVRRKAATEA